MPVSNKLTGFTASTQLTATAHVAEPSNGGWVDTSGYSEALFVIVLGDLTARTVGFHVEWSADGSTSGGDISGSATGNYTGAGDTGKCVTIRVDLAAASGKYLRGVADPTTGNPALTMACLLLGRQYVGQGQVGGVADPIDGDTHPTVEVAT